MSREFSCFSRLNAAVAFSSSISIDYGNTSGFDWSGFQMPAGGGVSRNGAYLARGDDLQLFPSNQVHSASQVASSLQKPICANLLYLDDKTYKKECPHLFLIARDVNRAPVAIILCAHTATPPTSVEPFAMGLFDRWKANTARSYFQMSGTIVAWKCAENHISRLS